MCTWGWAINTSFSAESSLPQECCHLMVELPAQHSEVRMQGRERAGSHRNLDLKKFLHILPDGFGACECFVKLLGAYCSHCCWALQKPAPRDFLASQDKPFTDSLSPTHSAGSREPTTSSCLSSSGSFSPAMWSCCINPCSYSASCVLLFLPEPLRASTSLPFLNSIAHTQLTGCALKLMQNSFAAFAQGTTCHKESAADLLPICKAARQAPK